MKGPFGYGRYDDGHIGCPRAQSDMTPCVAIDGHSAVDGGSLIDDRSVCVGCNRHPVDLLVELVKGASAMESRRMFEGGVAREAWVLMAVFTASLSPEHEACNCGDPEAAWGHLQTCPLYEQHTMGVGHHWWTVKNMDAVRCSRCGEFVTSPSLEKVDTVCPGTWGAE